MCNLRSGNSVGGTAELWLLGIPYSWSSIQPGSPHHSIGDLNARTAEHDHRCSLGATYHDWSREPGLGLHRPVRPRRERHLGAERYERSPERRSYTNGYKPKTFDTPAGTVTVGSMAKCGRRWN